MRDRPPFQLVVRQANGIVLIHSEYTTRASAERMAAKRRRTSIPGYRWWVDGPKLRSSRDCGCTYAPPKPKANRDEAWRTATKEGAPYLLWSDAVTLAAIWKGAPAEMMREPRIRKILHRAYDHGEPVWMAADEVTWVSKEIYKARRETQTRREAVRGTRRPKVGPRRER